MENLIQKPITRNRHLWADLIRIIAIFAVVAIHVNNFGFDLNKISWIDWWVSNVYNALIRFAVPMLFILSGYLLLANDIFSSLLPLLHHRIISYHTALTKNPGEIKHV